MKNIAICNGQFHPSLKVSQVKELPKCDLLIIGDSMQDVIILQSENKMNRHVEFSRIHMLFKALRLVLVAQYLISPSLTVDSNFVRRHKNLYCLKWVLCSFVVQYIYGRFLSSSDIFKPTELTKLAWLFKR